MSRIYMLQFLFLKRSAAKNFLLNQRVKQFCEGYEHRGSIICHKFDIARNLDNFKENLLEFEQRNGNFVLPLRPN